MKITEIEVRVGVTVNIGNYESARLDYSARAQIESEKETPAEAIDKCREYLKDKISKDLIASNGGKDILRK